MGSINGFSTAREMLAALDKRGILPHGSCSTSTCDALNDTIASSMLLIGASETPTRQHRRLTRRVPKALGSRLACP